MIGQTIHRYQIVEELGEGGMGTVYQAEDTDLGRPVALKFLAAHLLHDDEAKQRFIREAKAAAAITHPNICHVYEVGEADGKTFLAMAYLEGESLEDRIAKGPLPLKDALNIGRQVAEGLEAAHEKGIVHRDIKPANIMVGPKGRATILDFGLARLTEASKLTKPDQTVGTAAYMSPEQMQGGEVDHSTDVWALGCVLYEMVAGSRPFPGEYAQALAFEIVNQEPEPLTAVRAGVPMELEFIVGKCLAKEASDRYQRVDEIAVDLRTLADKLKSGRSAILASRELSAAGASPTRTANEAAPRPQRSVRVLQALVGLLGLALLGALTALWMQPAPETPEKLVRRFSFTTEQGQFAAISPDGRYVVYRQRAGGGGSSLWLRSLATEVSRVLPDTEGGYSPFWSPDSLSIGFFDSAELKRIALDGGPPLILCSVGSARLAVRPAGSWSPDGERIVYAAGALYEVAARGGDPRTLLSADEDLAFPVFLPSDGGPPAILYTRYDAVSFSGRIHVRNLDSGEDREIAAGKEAVYSSAGYLIYGAADMAGGESGLTALPFSRKTLEAVGDSFPVSAGGSSPSLSRDGALVYTDRSGMASRTLVWRNRRGEELERVGQAQSGLREFALSPDGRRVAATIDEPSDIWIQDLDRSTATRLTYDTAPEYITAWSPLGDAVLYSTTAVGLMRMRADGSGDPEILVEGAGSAPDWSRDGRYILYPRSGDIEYVELDENGEAGEPKPLLATPNRESNPKISPSGRFVAYVSNESGRNEVYVLEFPGGTGKVQASVDGGAQPRWSGDGSELFYVQDSELLLAVPVVEGVSLSLGRPQPLFRSADLNFRSRSWPQYDVSADGQRFLTSTLVESNMITPIRVVLNWAEDLNAGQ